MLIIFNNNEAYSQTTNTNNIKKYGQLSAALEMVVYGRMSDLIEQTGNEDTLGVLLYGDLHHIKTI